MTIHERIRTLRETHEWSIRDLARRSGVDFSLLGKWERNIEPRLQYIPILAFTFGMTVMQFLAPVTLRPRKGVRPIPPTKKLPPLKKTKPIAAAAAA